jgi:hypothetical protein
LASYAVFFVLPIAVESKHPVYRGVIHPDPSTINQVYISAILAVAFSYLGYWSCRHQFRSVKFQILQSRPTLDTLVLIAFSLLGINFLMQLVGFSYSSQWNRIVQVMFSRDLGIAILSLLYYRGSLSEAQKKAAIGAVATMTFFGLLSGMTQETAQPVFVWVLCRWIILRKFPVFLAILGIAFVLFLQPIKHEYRKQFWFSRAAEETSRLEKLGAYAKIADEYWLSSSMNKNESTMERTRFAITQRFSLLLFTQRYFELTPSRIPFKGGDSLNYVLYGWIPRAIWAGKPIATFANREFPIQYGIQHPNTARTASFGVGHVAEVYINYGMLGFPPVFFVLGCISYIPRLLTPSGESIGSLSIQVVSALNLMFIGSTAGIVFGGLISQVIAQSLIFIVGSHIFGSQRPTA